MKKTAIVSCYFQSNYGSMLQALATQMALDKLGYENETIDISGFSSDLRRAKIRYFVKASVTSNILLTKINRAKSLAMRKLVLNEYTMNVQMRDQCFKEFMYKHFRLSPKYSSMKELNEVCREHYSAVIVGSDQLWLPWNIVTGYYTLSFVPESVNSIAYATSFGQTILPSQLSKLAADFLKKIKHISIREESGQKLIKQLINRNVPLVCDPTLLFTGDQWMKIQTNIAPIIMEPYIFCYFLGNNPMHREFAMQIKKKTGLKIVALIHLDEYIKSDESYADVTPYNIDPSNFLNLIRNANYVCTDSFHCTVFSILYEKKFFTFRRFANSNIQSTNTRIDTLFHITGIGERLIKGDESVKKAVSLDIDYELVQKRLEKIRERSYEYLVDALEDKKNTDLSELIF